MFALLLRLRDVLWSGPLPLLLGAAGAVCLWRVRALPLRAFFPFLLRQKRQKAGAMHPGVSPGQALAVMLGATVGTGNIAGVALALCCGGPGAVFWMWVCAALSMGTAFFEQTLGVLYRGRAPGAGPMRYLAAGLRSPRAARLYAVCLALAALGMGGLVQANALAQTMQQAFSVPPVAVAVLAAAVCALSLGGGIRRLAALLSRLTPLMAGGYVLLCVAVLFSRRAQVLPALRQILLGAAGLSPCAGGTAGFALALRFGAMRGVFSNEAGLGSAVLAGAEAQVRHPCEQGMWGAVQVAVDTLVICTLTALAILVSGAYDSAGGVQGAALAVRAFSGVLGASGKTGLAVCLALFTVSTLLSWSQFGLCGARYAFGKTGARLYAAVAVGCAFFGCLVAVEPAFVLSDLAGGLMAVPNLSGVLLLGDEVRRAAADFSTKYARPD